MKLQGEKLHAANLKQFEDSRSFTLNSTDNFQLSVSSPIFNVQKCLDNLFSILDYGMKSVLAQSQLVPDWSTDFLSKKKKISPVQQLPSSVLLIFSLVVSQ